MGIEGSTNKTSKQQGSSLDLPQNVLFLTIAGPDQVNKTCGKDFFLLIERWVRQCTVAYRIFRGAEGHGMQVLCVGIESRPSLLKDPCCVKVVSCIRLIARAKLVKLEQVGMCSRLPDAIPIFWASYA